ncbi:hypothetical protein [Nonomuraea basaltis]|uniref:hypothetical protein n=1 Tax=Nonomuraea basaltis TaxID=2495887 RepID=UPI00110C4876|nr:hypothetical protein [Nonomuraea basaltis]TMR92623.1 hypothetical protein EJK15_43570 [Nonomuraea basaltis]
MTMRRRTIWLVAAGLAIAMASGDGTYALVKPEPPPVLTERTATKITLPDNAGVLYEHPSDPVRLTAYTLEYDPNHDNKELRPRSYARWESTFTKVAEDDQVASRPTVTGWW